MIFPVSGLITISEDFPKNFWLFWPFESITILPTFIGFCNASNAESAVNLRETALSIVCFDTPVIEIPVEVFLPISG